VKSKIKSMSIHTKQEEFWLGDFGKNYTERNSRTDEEWDDSYKTTWGITKLQMNELFIGHVPKNCKILEVGCNYGLQLRGLQRMNFDRLYGIELQSYAVEKAKGLTKGINIIQGSGYDIPFKDNFFDLVCTNGVLIHISPADHYSFMKEIHRCSKRFIMGWEYYDKDLKELNYRNNEGYMWKADFESIYRKHFPGLTVMEKHFIKYLSNDNVDAIFLLEKTR